jgi:uncharacterized protein YlxP (DUF503 family)
MFVGVGRFDLHIPHSGSLKAKRAVLRPVVERMRNKLHVSVAEVDHQDLWQRAAVGVTCVGSSIDQCRKQLQEVEKVLGLAALDGAEVTQRSIRFLSMDDL